MFELIFIHFSICLFMSGLIWLVQIVHYPSFRFSTKESFEALEQFHVRSISFIVAPLMTLELITGTVLLTKMNNSFTLINLILLILIWLSTFRLSIPLHNKLSLGYDLATINKLIKTNWPRTVLWSVRSILLFYFIIQYKGMIL